MSFQTPNVSRSISDLVLRINLSNTSNLKTKCLTMKLATSRRLPFRHAQSSTEERERIVLFVSFLSRNILDDTQYMDIIIGRRKNLWTMVLTIILSSSLINTRYVKVMLSLNSRKLHLTKMYVFS